MLHFDILSWNWPKLAHDQTLQRLCLLVTDSHDGPLNAALVVAAENAEEALLSPVLVPAAQDHTAIHVSTSLICPHSSHTATKTHLFATVQYLTPLSSP